MPANNPDHPKLIEISGIQKSLYGFYFFSNNAEDIKVALKEIKFSQRHLVSPRRQTDVRDSLNETPVLLLDFVQILNALIDKKIVTLKEGITIEGLFALPDVDENNPLGLSQEDFCLKKDSINRDRISLSETAITTISALLFKKKLDIETLVSKTNLVEKTLRSFLRGASIQKDSFLTILNLLANHGVIEKPKTGFDQFLSNARNETSNPTVSNTATACASAGSNSNAQIATLAAATFTAQGQSAGS
jgi:hypothetical protein